jgi:glutamate synthase domain-containing protein 2
MSPRKIYWLLSAAGVATVFMFGMLWKPAFWGYAIVLPLVGLGLLDMKQRSHALMRNFPVIGRGRYFMEELRPPLQQYFVESETSGRPFSRELRSLVYQRAKKSVDTRPFGTVNDLYEVGAEWMPHSMAPVHIEEERPRLLVGEGRCAKAYSASLLNVSAMSYGSLSRNAVLALNAGAKIGGFAHNTGEGGLSPHHLEPGGDLVWQIGTGYFSCRTPDGHFNPEAFAERAALPAVRMIEVKLSQGAKPGHGGILPAAKLTPEIVAIRGVVPGQDVISPPAHTAFSTPIGLLEFLQTLREASGGKPVGFKLCIGKRHEFFGIVKAMLESGIRPDFITVDGGEGGTGAAPLEFSDSVGTPLNDGLAFAHNALVGAGAAR